MRIYSYFFSELYGPSGQKFVWQHLQKENN